MSSRAFGPIVPVLGVCFWSPEASAGLFGGRGRLGGSSDAWQDIADPPFRGQRVCRIAEPFEGQRRYQLTGLGQRSTLPDV